MRRAVLLSCLVLVTCPLRALAAPVESVLHNFSNDDGAYPQNSLIADGAGNLYGTAGFGGDTNSGVVFAIDPNGVFSVIHHFQGMPNDGSAPSATLVLDKDGNLYGTTYQGGSHPGPSTFGAGTVFQLVPAGGGVWTENILYNFCARKNCADGQSPADGITIAENGTLYSTTQSGGTGAVQANRGTVFRLAPPKPGGAWKYTVLYDFCSQPGCADGAYPFAGPLLLSKSGQLIGTAASSDHGGTLFSLAVDGSGFQVLHDFGVTSADGRSPFSGVVADRNGVVYGMTPMGGAHDCGTAYSFDPAASTYDTFYSFCAEAGDPSFPQGLFTPIEDRNGLSLYAMSLGGGPSDKGTVFRLRPPTRPRGHWSEKIVYSFCSQTDCADGYLPSMGTVLRHDRAFYGTVSHGGAGDVGVVFRLGKD
jgi:uncharacterized repeat protein (TIGR03803 family)